MVYVLIAVQFGIEDQAQYDAALKILIPLGEYFQIQDDYLDAFADPEVLGKIGTDILVRPPLFLSPCSSFTSCSISPP